MIKYLVTICLMLLLYTNSALAMPPIMTTSELKPGMQGYAETVVQGPYRSRTAGRTDSEGIGRMWPDDIHCS